MIPLCATFSDSHSIIPSLFFILLISLSSTIFYIYYFPSFFPNIALLWTSQPLMWRSAIMDSHSILLIYFFIVPLFCIMMLTFPTAVTFHFPPWVTLCPPYLSFFNVNLPDHPDFFLIFHFNFPTSNSYALYSVPSISSNRHPRLTLCPPKHISHHSYTLDWNNYLLIYLCFSSIYNLTSTIIGPFCISYVNIFSSTPYPIRGEVNHLRLGWIVSVPGGMILVVDVLRPIGNHLLFFKQTF